MKNRNIIYTSLTLIIMALTSCGTDTESLTTMPNRTKMPIHFVMTYPGEKTRATDVGFEKSDQTGVYVCLSDTTLQIGGNVLNNERLTFDGTHWGASRILYWNDDTYNIYAYYPYIKNINSIEDQPFSISLNQSTERTSSTLGGYEASDLLYACSKNIAGTESPVQLNFKHIMSKLTIRLIKGEDFEGEMPTNATVYVHNTVPEATIDFNVGVATRYIKGSRQTIIAHHDQDYIYSAIIVPQRIQNRMPLIEVVMNGMSYLFESTFQFKPGIEHLVNLIIPNNPDNIKIEISSDIKQWN